MIIDILHFWILKLILNVVLPYGLHYIFLTNIIIQITTFFLTKSFIKYLYYIQLQLG